MNALRREKISKVVASTFFLFLTSIIVVGSDITNNFKQWNISGPTGGDVRSIMIDPNNKNNVFISTLDGQVHASYNRGVSWKLLVNLNRSQLILDNLIVDSRDSNVIYTAGHRHKRPGGFFKTTDGGKTWREAAELKSEAVHALVQSSRDPNMLLAGTVNGVWVSRDSGDTWSKFSSPSAPKKLDALAIDPRDANTIYAGTWWRAYKTTDGGKNWRLIKKGMIDDSDVFAVDINSHNPDHIIASACSGIYQSFNKGENWSKIKGIPSRSRRTRAILQNPGKAGTIYAGTTEGFWMSSDGGKRWALTTSKKLEINSIAVHPSDPNRVYIATNNYGVMVSTNGGRSFGSNNGNFTSRFTYKITPDSERPNRFYATTRNTATGGGFVFISNDSGVTWAPSIRNIDTKRTIAYSLIQDKTNANIVYLGTNFGLFKSINRGATWALIKAPKRKSTRRRRKRRRRRGKRRRTKRKTPVKKAVKLAVGTVAVLSTQISVLAHTNDGKNGFLAGTSRGLYRSDDIAKGWTKINLGAGVVDQIMAIHVSPKQPNTIWVGTAISGVQVSRDNGVTWSRVGAKIIPNGVPVSSIMSNPGRPNDIFVGTIQTLYLSRDNGVTWNRRGGNLPLGNYNSIVMNPNNPNEIFVASSKVSNGGIFQSTDAGWTWKQIDKGVNMASRRVWSLVLNPNNTNELLAGTHSSGIYRIGRTQTASLKKPVKATEETKTKLKETVTRSRVASGN